MGCTGPWAVQEGLYRALDPPKKDCTGPWSPGSKSFPPVLLFPRAFRFSSVVTAECPGN